MHPIPSQILAFELCADNKLNGPSPFSPEDVAFMISKNLKFYLNTP